jgi:hypothetical protein
MLIMIQQAHQEVIIIKETINTPLTVSANKNLTLGRQKLNTGGNIF